MKHQTKQQRRGEVHFRSFHADYVKQHLPFVKRLISFRKNRFSHLAFEGFPLTPYLEIGAELCINGMILENFIGQQGVAADLSRDALATAQTYSDKLELTKLPFRVCSDAYRLPLRNDSINFVFGWGTFHHFPDPTPIFKEARRVMHPDGVFFFDEEPIRRRLSLNLYNTYTPQELKGVQKILYRTGLLPYLAVLGGRAEIERGILEGTFGIAQLRQQLSVFNEVKLNYNPLLTGGVASEGAFFRWLFQKLFSRDRAADRATRWFGGAVSGICRKHERGLNLQAGFTFSEDSKWLLDRQTILLVKKAPQHDRLTVVLKGQGDEDCSLFIDQAPCSPKIDQQDDGNCWLTCDLSPEQKDREVLTVKIEGASGQEVYLDRIALDSSTQPGSFYQHLPIDPQADRVQPEKILGCPNCLTVSSHCVADLCNRPCADAVDSGAIQFENGRAAIKPGTSFEAIYACPFKCIDRSALQLIDEEYRCIVCGKRYPIHEGVVTLLPAEAEADLYGN